MAGPTKKQLEKQAREILEAAKAAGLEEHYFFATTFRRYQTQLRLLDELEKVLEDEDVLVQKTYVKGRPNVYANPAIAQYNSTADAANRSVATLLKIVSSYRPAPQESDELLEYINRR